MNDSLILTFLYRTLPGRMALKLLVHPAVSKAAGRFLSSGASRWIVPYFIRKHQIDLSGMEIPEGGYTSFNEFFVRKRKREFQEASEDCLISPCDGFLTPVEIRKNTLFGIKNTRFNLEDLLMDGRLAAEFRDGLALVFRLTPANYHRYCYAADGRVCRSRRIPGKLHCVRPIALREIPVFAQNSREYQVIRTGGFGLMIQMEIGALLVGKICNRSLANGADHIEAGEEKGYFEFGGSTILLLLRKDTACLCEKLYERKNGEGEIPVVRGERVAVKRKRGS